MKLIKFIIEFGNHVLDILSLLLLVNLVHNSLLNISFGITRNDLSSSANHELSLYLGSHWFLSKDGLNRSILILLKHLDVTVVDVIHSLIIDFALAGYVGT